MGLIHPTDLPAWQSWQDSKRRVRALKGSLVRHDPWVVLARGEGADASAARVVVGVDASHRSVALAVASPLAHLIPSDCIVVLPQDGGSLLPPGQWHLEEVRVSQVADALSATAGNAQAVMAAGHYTAIGRALYAWSHRRGVPFFVAQHGLLTPRSPPLPDDATLLAWSAVDAEFWWSGRPDARSIEVGSQLLMQASRHQGATEAAAQPLFLGQLHGAELPHRLLAQAAETFCLTYHARYRGHPGETDRRSRKAHEQMRRVGITFETSGQPLISLGAPVVSVFSTGLLEAAASGLSAYTFCPGAPAWVEELWHRYGLSPYGASTPSAAPPVPTVEPAERIANILMEGR